MGARHVDTGGHAVRPFAVLVALFAASCAPISVSRIGPQLVPREKKCAVEVLDIGRKPDRPYRDVGLVAVETCEDYRTPPCRTWIEEAACGLGGQIVYADDSPRPSSPTAPALRARVLVAVYVSDLRPDPETDPMLRSRECDPPCGDGMRCANRECVPAAGPDCGAAELKVPAQATPVEAPEKCLE